MQPSDLRFTNGPQSRLVVGHNKDQTEDSGKTLKDFCHDVIRHLVPRLLRIPIAPIHRLYLINLNDAGDTYSSANQLNCEPAST